MLLDLIMNKDWTWNIKKKIFKINEKTNINTQNKNKNYKHSLKVIP